MLKTAVKIVNNLKQPAHKNSPSNRIQTMRNCLFVFNGKERDPETGFLYYGARYYWSELWTGWLSVDPMIDKYPGISPYNYCNLNPVNLVDPDGREMDDWELKNNGCLIWDKETHGNVVDRIVAEDGSYVVVPSGVLAKDDQDGGGNYLHAGAINFTIDKMENAFEIFEFLADKSSVEYSLIGLSQSEESGTINTYKIFSSMDPNGDRFGTVESYKMAEKGRLRIHIHNHPNGTSSPSNAINSKGKGNDSQFEKNIMKIQNNKPCSFYIYSSKQNGIYRRYGDNSGLIINSSVSKGLHYFYSK